MLNKATGSYPVHQSLEFRDKVISETLLEKASDWIQENLDPEDVFSDEQLSTWALHNGFKRSAEAQMRLTDLYDKLEKADWTYEYSDDFGVWKAGKAELSRLYIEAEKLEGGVELYTEFQNYAHFHTDKPTRPDGY